MNNRGTIRVSHSTTIDDLLKSEFHLTIEGTKYHVVPPKEKSTFVRYFLPATPQIADVITLMF
jgi:hypothetical protein